MSERAALVSWFSSGEHLVFAGKVGVTGSRGFEGEDLGTETVPFCRGMMGVLVTLFSAQSVGKHSMGAVGDGS